MSQPTDVQPILIPEGTRPHGSTKRKHWCFTLFYVEEGRDCIFPTELPPSCTYLMCQRESCPDTGRTHVQGYIACSSAVRFTVAKLLVQQLFGTTASPRMAYIRGSVGDNIRYCSKPDTRLPGTEPLELGERPLNGDPSNRPAKEKGKATKLARELILARKSATEVLQNEDYAEAWGIVIRGPKAWNSLVAELSPHRSIMVSPTVIVFYGPSRTGKTRLAVDMYPNAYMKPSGKWWLQYKGQTEVIYDDFDGGDMFFSDWKRVFDRYSQLIEPKGGDAPLAATTHIITTNVWPSHWYQKKVTGRYGRDAIWGRISQIWDFHTKPPTVYDGDQVLEFRQLPSNWALEDSDPKARAE